MTGLEPATTRLQVDETVVYTIQPNLLPLHYSGQIKNMGLVGQATDRVAKRSATQAVPSNPITLSAAR